MTDIDEEDLEQVIRGYDDAAYEFEAVCPGCFQHLVGIPPTGWRGKCPNCGARLRTNKYRLFSDDRRAG